MPTDDVITVSTPPPPAGDRQEVQSLVAACIEAMEVGDADPVARVCSARPDLATRVQKKLAQLTLRGLLATGGMPTPSTIGAFKIRRELGSGGMGTVGLASNRANSGSAQPSPPGGVAVSSSRLPSVPAAMIQP